MILSIIPLNKMVKKILIISFIIIVIPFVAGANKQAEVLLQELGVGPDGQCTTVEECRKYCSKSDESRLVCLDFAREHGLIDEGRYERVKRALTVKPEGPNGCRGLACRQECRIEENYDQCLAYIEDNDLTVPEQVEKIKELREQLQKRVRLTPTRSNNPKRIPLPRTDEAEIEDKLFQERLRHENTLKRIEDTRKVKYEPAIRPLPTHNFHDAIERNRESDARQRIKIELDEKQKNMFNRFGGFIYNAIKSFFD